MEQNYERIQAVVRPEVKSKFEELFISSGSNSKGEFILKLIDKFAQPEKVIEKPIEVIKEVEKLIIRETERKLEDNEILVKLSPIQKAILFMAVDTDVISDPDESDDDMHSYEGKGDQVYKQQNYFAYSPSYRQKFGNMFTPLIADQPDKNLSRILINTFMFAVYKGWEIVPEISRRELKELAADIKSKNDEQERLMEVIRNLSIEQREELLKEDLEDEKTEEKTPEKETEIID